MLNKLIAVAIAASFASIAFAETAAPAAKTTPSAVVIEKKAEAPKAVEPMKAEAAKSVAPAKTEAVKADAATPEQKPVKAKKTKKAKAAPKVEPTPAPAVAPTAK